MTPVQVRLARTDELGEARLAGVRLLMDAAFPDDFEDTDWDHALGGTHALVEEGDRVVAHGSIVWRELLVDGHPLRTAYVEAVAVAPDRRRRGLADAVMAALEARARAEGAELLALGSSDQGQPLYRSRGWLPWPGPTGVRTGEDGWSPTPDDDGAVLVLAGTTPLPDPSDGPVPLVCDPRPGDVW